MSQDFRYRLADALSDLHRRKPEAIEAASEIMNLLASYGYEQTATLRARLAQLESVLAEAGKALPESELLERADYYERWASDIRKMNGTSVDADHSDKTAAILRRAASVSNQIAALKEDGK